MTALSKETANALTIYIDAQGNYLDVLARNDVFLNEKNYTVEDKMEILKKEVNINGNKELLYITKDGEGISTSGIKFSAIDKEFFKTAIKGSIFMSEPMISYTNNSSVVIVIAAPVKDKNGEITGVVTAVRNASVLRDFVNEMSFGRTGYVSVFDRKDVAVANKDMSLVKNFVNVFEKKQKRSKIERIITTF